MDLTELNKSPDSLMLHDGVLLIYKEEKDKLTLRFSLGDYQYDVNQNNLALFKDIFKDPKKNYLYLDLVFYGYTLKKDASDENFDFCDTEVLDVDVKDNTYSACFLDMDKQSGNMVIKYKSFEWKYVGEYTKRISYPRAFMKIV